MPDEKISIIAPCLNEEENVETLYRRIKQAFTGRDVSFELVLVDDGSTDRTWEKCCLLVQSEYPNVIAVRHAKNHGIPSAWVSGLEKASGIFVCLIDSDLQNPPECVLNLYDALAAERSDLVRAVRVPEVGQRDTRYVLSRVLNLLLNITFKMSARDSKSGFVLGRKSTVFQIVKHRGTYRHFQTFLGVSAHFNDLKVTEVNTPFCSRFAGTSFLSGRVFRTMWDVLVDLIEARREFSVQRSNQSG